MNFGLFFNDMDSKPSVTFLYRMVRNLESSNYGYLVINDIFQSNCKDTSFPLEKYTQTQINNNLNSVNK